MAVIVLPIEKGKTLANKIIANNRQTKVIVAHRRAYKMRQSGHDITWIANKLGMSKAAIRAMLV